MISKKVIEIYESINAEFPKENTAYQYDEIKYGFTQRVIELTLKEALGAVDSADLRSKTFTTYDKDNLDFCKKKVRIEIYKLIDQIRPVK